MGLAPREFRPLKQHRYDKTLCYYLGQWRIGTDIMEGRGVIIFCDDGSVYEGYFRKNKIDSYGRYMYHTGNSYQGGFNAGKRHGFGTMNGKLLL